MRELIPTQDSITQSIVGITIALIFVLLALEKAHRVLVVIGAAAFLWAVTYLTPFHPITFEATGRSIDFNVVFLLAAMMTLVGVLKTTGVFEWAVARLMLRAAGRPLLAQRLMVWISGVLSAFCDNVTTVIFVAPMASGVSRQLRVPLVAILLPIVMASNIGGTATLIGDPPNIMIGSGARLTFLDFVVNLTVPVVLMMFALEWISRRYYRASFDSASPTSDGAPTLPAIRDPRLLRWTLGITAAVFVGFFTHGITGMPAAVPATIGAAAALVVQDVLYLRRNRPTTAERVHGLLEIIEREIEWPTLLFFTFLFIVVGAAVETGLIARLADGLRWAVVAGGEAMHLTPRGTLLFAALLILWVSGVLSALLDNIPYVAVSIPIVARLVESLSGDTVILWWALALGACLGGNGSPVGASANVTVIGLAERTGERISFREFTHFGSRVTLATLLISSAFVTSHIMVGQQTTFWIGIAMFAAILLVRFITPLRERSVARAAQQP